MQGTGLIDAGSTIRRSWPLSAEWIGVLTSAQFQVWHVVPAPDLVRRVSLPSDVRWTLLASVSDGRIALARDSTPWRAKEVELLDLATGETVVLSGEEEGRIEGLTASPSGRLVAWCLCNPEAATFKIVVTDVGSRTAVAQAEGPLFFRDQTISVLRFSRDERLLCFGGSTGELSLGVMDVQKKDMWYRKDFGPWDMAFSPDGSRFFATNAVGCLACYDSLSRREIWSDIVYFPSPAGFFSTVQANERLLAVDVSPDGRLVAASTDYTHKVIIWDAETGKRVRTLDLSDYPIEQALFFDPSGRGLWAAGSLDTKLTYFPLE
jgi:WD40 repeat protein